MSTGALKVNTKWQQRGDTIANGARSAASMASAHQAWADGQPQTVRCAFCPRWKFTGTAEDCRTAATLHRADVHPELAGKRGGRKRKGALGLCSQACGRKAAIPDGVYGGWCTPCRDEALRGQREKPAKAVVPAPFVLTKTKPVAERPPLALVEPPVPKDASESATAERVIGAICPEGLTAAELAEHAARILNVVLAARKKQAGRSASGKS